MAVVGNRTPAARRTVVALVGVLLLAGCASAPVSAVDHASGGYSDPVEIEVAGEPQVVVREIRIAPGASTGEHCHHGQLIAVVAEGELTHYAPIYPGGVHVYEEGDAVIEGAGYVHEGVNEGDEDLVLWVTYIIEEGEPLAETDLSRCDDQAAER